MADRCTPNNPILSVHSAAMAISPAHQEHSPAADVDCTAASTLALLAPQTSESVAMPSTNNATCISSRAPGAYGAPPGPPDIRVSDPRPSGSVSGDGEWGSRYSWARGVPGDHHGDSCADPRGHPHGVPSVCDVRNAGNPSHTQVISRIHGDGAHEQSRHGSQTNTPDSFGSAPRVELVALGGTGGTTGATVTDGTTVADAATEEPVVGLAAVQERFSIPRLDLSLAMNPIANGGSQLPPGSSATMSVADGDGGYEDEVSDRLRPPPAVRPTAKSSVRAPVHHRLASDDADSVSQASSSQTQERLRLNAARFQRQREIAAARYHLEQLELQRQEQEAAEEMRAASASSSFVAARPKRERRSSAFPSSSMSSSVMCTHSVLDVSHADKRQRSPSPGDVGAAVASPAPTYVSPGGQQPVLPHSQIQGQWVYPPGGEVVGAPPMTTHLPQGAQPSLPQFHDDQRQWPLPPGGAVVGAPPATTNLPHGVQPVLLQFHPMEGVEEDQSGIAPGGCPTLHGGTGLPGSCGYGCAMGATG